MPPLTLIAILLCLASVFGFVNYQLLRLPSAIGLMVVAMFASLCIFAVEFLVPGIGLRSLLERILGTRDLPATLLQGALSFLLFAGALNVDLEALRNRKFTVLLLATIGVLISAGLFGVGIWAVFGLLRVDIPLWWCVAMGAILAPTDPVAVSTVIGRLGLPKTLQAVIAGESLFNDGVGVVVFATALAAAQSSGPPSLGSVGLDFLRETGGALILGMGTGWIACEMMRRIDDYPLEIMTSLALAAGSYALASTIGISGPISVVTAGLLIGGRGRRYAMSETTRANLTLFWSVIEELLNAVLFLLLGFEVLGLSFDLPTIVAAIVALPLAVAVRAVSIVAAVYWLHARNPARWRAVAVLTWGGLRGGISVALALSIRSGEWRSAILFVSYAVVVFTIMVQGLTIERAIGHLYPSAPKR